MPCRFSSSVMPSATSTWKSQVLADEADGAGLGLEHRLEAGIVGDRPPRPLGHAEGGERCEFERPRLGEQLGVGGIGAGIAGLDIVEPEPVELLGDQGLVLEREVDALGLRAVAERGVVKIEAFAAHRATSQVVTSSPVSGSLASFSSMPMAASSSRMRSASSKSLALRAALRASTKTATRPHRQPGLLPHPTGAPARSWPGHRRSRGR